MKDIVKLSKYNYNDIVHVIVELIKWCDMYGHINDSETPFYNTYINYVLSSNNINFNKINPHIAELIAQTLDVYYYVDSKKHIDLDFKSKDTYNYAVLMKRLIITKYIYRKLNGYNEQYNNIKNIYKVFPEWTNSKVEPDDIDLIINQLPIIISSIQPFECEEFDRMFVCNVKKLAKMIISIQDGYQTLYRYLHKTIENSAKYNESDLIGFKDDYLDNIFNRIISYEKKQLESMEKLENPIKDNRIISDKTFATRFKLFLNNISANDASSDEELEYFKMIANKLIKYQILTATEDEEINYLNMLYPKK
jgi:hypothetical protein